MGIGIAVAAGAWFLYEIVETHIPAILSGQANIIKQCAANAVSAATGNGQYNPI